MNFELNQRQLMDISNELKIKVQAGLQAQDTEIKCLPTYIPVPQSLINNENVYVLDLGGSNVRAALVSFHDQQLVFKKELIESPMPWERNKPLKKEIYLGIQSSLLESLGYPDCCPLGYCFSYPAESTPEGDAILKEWTKEIVVPGVVGQQLGSMLLNHISKFHQGMHCSKITVLNDTVASLLAGLTLPKVDACIGLIVGTGTNMATLINADDVPKIPGELHWKGLIPVNLESGGFSPPHLTQWDQEVDDHSEDVGKQRFEKAVSGAYLGRLFKAVFPESDFVPNSGAKGLVSLLNASRDREHPHSVTAFQIYTRSAKLVAASLAGLIKLLNGLNRTKTVRIVAEGSLFWGTVYGDQLFLKMTKATLDSILAESGLSDITVEFAKIENANLVGTALAALA